MTTTTTTHTINRHCDGCEGAFHPSSPEDVAQNLANTCYVIATHTGDMSRFDGPVYAQAKAALRAAVTVVYGEELTGDILEVWEDCGESLAYCADVARRKVADRQEVQDDADREVFLHALALKLAAQTGGVGIADHILTTHQGVVRPERPLERADVIFEVLAGDTKCGCGAEHPELADATFLTAMALVLGVDVPRVSVLSNMRDAG